MGHTITYQLVRSSPLLDSERAALATFVAQCAGQHWDSEPFQLSVADHPHSLGILALGTTKVAMDDESEDAEQVETCLEQALRLSATPPYGSRMILASWAPTPCSTWATTSLPS